MMCDFKIKEAAVPRAHQSCAPMNPVIDSGVICWSISSSAVNIGFKTEGKIKFKMTGSLFRITPNADISTGQIIQFCHVPCFFLCVTVHYKQIKFLLAVITIILKNIYIIQSTKIILEYNLRSPQHCPQYCFNHSVHLSSTFLMRYY